MCLANKLSPEVRLILQKHCSVKLFICLNETNTEYCSVTGICCLLHSLSHCLFSSNILRWSVSVQVNSYFNFLSATEVFTDSAVQWKYLLRCRWGDALESCFLLYFKVKGFCFFLYCSKLCIVISFGQNIATNNYFGQWPNKLLFASGDRFARWCELKKPHQPVK